MKNKIPGLVLSFVLSLVVMILFVCSGVSLGILNSKKLSQTLTQSDYYNIMAKDAASSVSDYVTGQELPPSVLDGILEEDQMMLDAKGYVDAQLNGKGGSIATDSFQTKLTKNILEHLNQAGSVNAVEVKRGVKEITSTASAIYREHLELKAVSYYSEWKKDLSGMIKGLFIGSVVVAAMLVLVLLKFQSGTHRGIRYIAYSMCTASILQGLITWQMGSHFVIKGTGAYYQVVNQFFKDAMVPMYVMSGIGLILFAAALFGTETLKQKGD